MSIFEVLEVVPDHEGEPSLQHFKYVESKHKYLVEAVYGIDDGIPFKRYGFRVREIKVEQLAKWVDVNESGEYDTVYQCPKCNFKYSIQAEDMCTSLTCSCGFKGDLR